MNLAPHRDPLRRVTRIDPAPRLCLSQYHPGEFRSRPLHASRGATT